MTYIKITSPSKVIDYLVQLLTDKLSEGKVLWLLSGGSAIDIEVNVAKKLNSKNLKNLAISLVDERFGPPGHADSNWQQLATAGFNLKGAKALPVLSGLSLSDNAKKWQQAITEELNAASYVVAVAGIGADGHTFGIKPGSPALKTDELVAAFEWNDFARITLSAAAMPRINEIVVYAVGPEKKQQLKNLKQTFPPTEQPAQLLKLCSKLSVFNDQLS